MRYKLIKWFARAQRDFTIPRGFRITAFKWIPRFLTVGEKVVRIVYSNHTIAYYHEDCYEKKGVKTHKGHTENEEKG